MRGGIGRKRMLIKSYKWFSKEQVRLAKKSQEEHRKARIEFL